MGEQSQCCRITQPKERDLGDRNEFESQSICFNLPSGRRWSRERMRNPGPSPKL